MTEQEVEQTVQEWVRKYEQTAENVKQELGNVKDEAVEIAGEAADALAMSAFLTFIMLVLGAAAAGVGGAVGRIKDRVVLE